MTIEEIKSKICDLRCSVEELQEQAQNLWKETDDERTESLADYLDNELGYVAYKLSELEELDTDSEGNPDTDGLEDGLNEWWDDLSNEEKTNISGIHFPTADDGGRGDNDFEFTERTNKWWNSRTISQKREIQAEYTLGY